MIQLFQTRHFCKLADRKKNTILKNIDSFTLVYYTVNCLYQLDSSYLTCVLVYKHENRYRPCNKSVYSFVREETQQ